MNLVKNKYTAANPDESLADFTITSQASKVRQAYREMDEAAVIGLERLEREDGIVASCKLGCSHCCQFHIVTNIAEAVTLAQYIKKQLSADQVEELRIRTQKWHAWDSSRPGRYPTENIDTKIDFSDYIHCCPLLVNGKCIVYPVRPSVCRTHYVCSQPLLCLAANNPKSELEPPIVMKSILEMTNSFSLEIKELIEKAGIDFSRSIMLLPHWLAIQMDWDFAISP